MPHKLLFRGVFCGFLSAFLVATLSAQDVTPTPSASSSPAATVPDVVLGTPTPSPTISTAVAPDVTPPPHYDTSSPGAVESTNTFQWSESGAPVFNLDQAVIQALQANADILRAEQEIERTKGVVIQIVATALPHINPQATLDWTDPNLGGGGSSFQTSGTGTGGGGSSVGGSSSRFSDTTYNIRILGSQLIFNGFTGFQIRGTFFQRDSSYFAFRNTVDTVVATTKEEYYQVLVNRALIGVQEESVRLLESQLKDQENRFEAGTVPRFNVLQAQVQLSNQIPVLIAARNTYRISVLTLAKTLGLDFNPARGIAAPIRVVGELVYTPRYIHLLDSIEEAKRNRPFLKEARANVLNQLQQLHAAVGNFAPQINTTGGYEFLSSPFTTQWNDVSHGWVFGLQGTWPGFWDSGETWGLIKQQRALLSETKITYDDDVRQIELEVQTAASNVLQNRELIQATEKSVEQADEAVRLAKARLDAGAGTQLDVLNAQVQLTTAQSTRLQALSGYQQSLAEFDRVTGAQSTYTEVFNGIAPRATRTRTYYTGSDVDAEGDPKRPGVFAPGPVTPMERRTTTTTTTHYGK